MKEKHVIKALLLWYIFLLIGNTSLYGQSEHKRKLLVPSIGQETYYWCWAACMRMVMKFHEPASTSILTQCDLAKQLYEQSTQFIAPPDDCCFNCADGCPPPTRTNCVRLGFEQLTIPFSFENITPTADNYDILFSLNGYSSIQEINRNANPISWAIIKNQIEDCRPFIINIEPTPSGEITGNHALVVIGFQEISSVGGQDSIRAIITNDPWRPCCGENESYFPYDIFESIQASGITSSGDPTYLVNRVLSAVHTIYPQENILTEEDCLSCDVLGNVYEDMNMEFIEEFNSDPDSPDDPIDSGGPDDPSDSDDPDEPDPGLQPQSFEHQSGISTRNPNGVRNNFTGLLKILEQNPDQVIGYKKTTLEDDFVRDSLGKEIFPYAPVKYISTKRLGKKSFLSCLFPPRKLEKIMHTGYEVIDVVSAQVDENIVTTLQKTQNNKWAVRRISNYTYLKKDINIRIEGTDRSITLNNKAVNESNTENAIHYTLVKYPPEQYEFVRFSQGGGKYFMAPLQNYPELQLKKNIGYKESKVIRKLRRELRISEKLLAKILKGIRMEDRTLNSTTRDK